VIAGAFVDGWDLTQAAKADGACGTATGTCSVVALLKFLNVAVGSAVPVTVNATATGVTGLTPGVAQTGTIIAINTDQTSMGGVAYGAMANYGSNPGAVKVASVNASTEGQFYYNVASSVLTRIANTTAYAANETVCLFTSVTVCAPITISIGNVNTGKGFLNRINLLKSGSSTTNASFKIWLYSAAPGTSTPSQFDSTSYTGPRAGDLPNYIGVATCATGTATSDTTAQVWYECALSNPNSAGLLEFQALSGGTTIDALISVTAAYTPASGETFTVYASGVY
jgi:hypothetical protein